MFASERKVNKRIVTNRISKLRVYLKVLRELQKASFEEFSSNPRIRYSAERCLHLAIECAINIGNHIISALQLRKPEEYHDIALILEENGVIPSGFAEEFVKMIRFRNILVHDYVGLDISRVYTFLQERLADFELFIEYVTKFLKSKQA
ncbi:MAG: DUF86 domain-containing protein [Candidatus Bathyarchaeia archaeon]|nr:DUF86 domain-containing protein [Candidatus Bathyarchaeia archaeon]